MQLYTSKWKHTTTELLKHKNTNVKNQGEKHMIITIRE